MKYGRSEEIHEQLEALGRRGDLRALLSTEQGRAWWWRTMRYILAVSPSLDLETLTRVLVPVTGPEMEEAMLTYGQKMELEMMQRAEAKAREEVTLEATLQGQRDFLLRLLTRRFGSLPATIIERVQQAGTHELEQWGDRILDATSLDDVFAA
jgi:hypothetical protein